MNAILGLTAAQWALLFIALAFTLLFLRIFQRLRAVLIFAGICLAGGKAAALLAGFARGVAHLTDDLTGKIFGVTLAGVIVVPVLIILVYDLHPKGGGASRRTFWISAFVACLLVAGVSSFHVLNSVPANIRTGITSVTTNGG